MTVTFKKVGEKVASKVLQTGGSSVAPKAASAVAPGMMRELKSPRAVSKQEAPMVKPAKEASKVSMMPWKGWVDRLMKEKMDPKTYKGVKDFFYFWPEDPHNLQQAPYPDTRITISADGKETAAFREVAPGSQPAVDVPRDDLDADPYDSKYFTRDTRRRYVDPEFPHSDVEMLKLQMQDQNDPEVIEAKKQLEAGPPSSPGNGCRFATGPSDFDPTGLRAVMAVNNKELFKELDKHMPDHLPEPTWMKNEAELLQWYKDRDLPVPIGGNWKFVGQKRRVAKW
mmetsp:Transcript_10041/g.16040  ORF Transcript_10041/g.16040 Transcript_10041/m.16040 type:complete len:283 (-) Transcript_10041:32-880(-)|eukprot:CAMPEP_0178757028 /NCGR_PEP_ID=MMETSP0744-20121128/13604_1 /TAXON_ID=913974 /ORGANISM="Nitzschia punctata, Strain CCMP561" /LENGTH=282 /DNA_ID=CAMNT_0020411239 /DNA_START=30 /DNA_END=878 /DNA_ORIENTATION=-